MRAVSLLRSQLFAALALPGALVACGVEEESALDGPALGPEIGGDPMPASSLPTPVVLNLAAPATVQGVAQTAVVTGAQPGETVWLGGSLRGLGAGPCPRAWRVNNVCFDIRKPEQLGSAVADATGTARIPYALPMGLPANTAVYLQAAAASGTSAPATGNLAQPALVCGVTDVLRPNNIPWSDAVACLDPAIAGGTCPTWSTITPAMSDRLFEEATGMPALPGSLYQIDPFCDETGVTTECCYAVHVYGTAIGRPFTVGGEVRQACRGGQGWAEAVDVPVARLSRRLRRRLARGWTAIADAEHASVASFASFILDLVALGAPADLVAEATRAMADEVRHASEAYSLASSFLDAPVGPGALDTSGTRGPLDVEAVVLAAVREGCIAETMAAAQVRAAAHLAEDPALRARLTAVAEDETRHAALAWRFVQWALASHPELHDAVAAAFDVPPVLDARSAMGHDGETRSWGLLPASELEAVGLAAWHGAIAPAARALLGEARAAA